MPYIHHHAKLESSGVLPDTEALTWLASEVVEPPPPACSAYFVVAYPRFTRYLAQEWFVNATETPTQVGDRKQPARVNTSVGVCPT